VVTIKGHKFIARPNEGLRPLRPEEDDFDSDNELENGERGDIHQKQHDYYQAGISNVAIHYAKVHRSTIPNNDKFLRNQHRLHSNNIIHMNHHHKVSNSTRDEQQQQQSSIITNQICKVNTVKKNSITNLAKHSAGLTMAVTKDVAFGLGSK